MTRNKRRPGQRDRRGEVLFIYAYDFGVMKDRIHRDLTEEEIRKLFSTYRAWRGDLVGQVYKDEPGFCRAASTEEIRAHAGALVPGRYVGFARSATLESSHEDLYREFVEIRRRVRESGQAAEAALHAMEKLFNGNAPA